MTQADFSRNSSSPWKQKWDLDPEVTYLNHGSFGPSPRVVCESRESWTRRLEQQPMRFFLDEMEQELQAAYESLANFVKCSPDELLFVPNATVAMNILAKSLSFSSGDEILCSDQEYGAVLRIWREVCKSHDATLKVQPIPWDNLPAETVAERFLEGTTSRTRLILISHVTSPTAVIFPVREICQQAKHLRIPVCIDGPHAPAMLPLNLSELNCDFYTASCHKWLSAPFGSGFLYARKKYHQRLSPLVRSWGGNLSGREVHWRDEFTWFGTFDPAPYLAIPTAISFLKNIGLKVFRHRTHQLISRAREMIEEITGLPALRLDATASMGSMIALPLPAIDWKPKHPAEKDPLQTEFREKHQLEIPITHWKDQRLMRVSCHLYNDEADLHYLADLLGKLL